jgi:hypothetical protein
MIGGGAWVSLVRSHTRYDGGIQPTPCRADFASLFQLLRHLDVSSVPPARLQLTRSRWATGDIYEAL